VPSIDEIKELGSESRAKYYGIWKRHLKRMGQSVLGSLASNPWFRQWSDSYDILEERSKFLGRCTKQLEEDPTILLDYVLDSNKLQ
jgi:hypothetical protein